LIYVCHLDADAVVGRVVEQALDAAAVLLHVLHVERLGGELRVRAQRDGVELHVHPEAHLQVHRGSPLQVRTRSPLQVRAR
jgi:hypothetical protein